MRPFPDQPGLYDLCAFSSALPRGKDFKRINGIIRNLFNAGSADADLAMAAMHLRVATDMEASIQGSSNPDMLHAAGASYNWALILYVRATHTSSDHRGAVAIVKHYSAEQRELHQAMVSLRNDALAHYGIGPKPHLPWSRDAVVLCINHKQDMKINLPPFRRAYMADVNDALATLLPRSKDINSDNRRLLGERFFEEYRNLLRSYSWIKEKLASCSFDAASYCESAERGARLYADIMGGDIEPTDIPIYRAPPTRFFRDEGRGD